jgi:sugar phosphate isomerase/epimerase
MADRIALQMYTVRDVIAKEGYEQVVHKVAAMGYKAVEPAGFPGITPQAAAKIFQDLGLSVAAAHVGLPLGDRKNQILEQLDALGKPPMVCTQIGRNDVKTMDTIKDLCDRLNQGYEVAKTAGLDFGIHNHDHEFGFVDGKLIHEVMVSLLNPGIFFEIDTYWVQVGGCDPAEIVRKLGTRARMLHIKDGAGTHEGAQTAVGDGVMDFPKIFQAAGDNAKWWVIELDECETDVMVAVQKSYNYLKKLA